MNLIEYLDKNGVRSVPNGDYIAIQCPFCRKEDVSGNVIMGFNINLSTNWGECGNSECRRSGELDEWSEALGITKKKEARKLYNKISDDANIKSNFDVMKVDQILSTDFGPDEWVIIGLVPENSITAIAGAPSSYKTWLTLDIARCISSGEDFLGKFKVTKGSVLFVDKENQLKHIKNRLVQISIGKDHQIHYLSQLNLDFFIDSEENFLALKDIIQNLGIKVVVFDSLVRIHSGDENDAKCMSLVMGRFRQITNLGVSVIFIHHHRKESVGSRKSMNSVRGSSDIPAGVDCLLIIEKIPDELQLVINQAKLRQDEAQEPFAVTIESDKTTKSIKFIYAGAYDPNKMSIDELKLAVPTILKEKGETAKQELVDLLSGEYKTGVINGALKELVENGSIIKNVLAHGKHTYILKK